jgi:hypothetical protein
LNTIGSSPQAHLREFLFRGNAVAAGGFLTRLDGQSVPLNPNVVTTHGESCLPLAGGVSHSLVQNPVLPFPQYIRYEACTTSVLGEYVKDGTQTTLTTSANNIQVTTSPSPEDNVSGVQSISFHADHVSLTVRSTHPLTGQPSFQVVGVPQLAGLALVVTEIGGSLIRLPIGIQFDQALLALPTLDALDNEFLTNGEFFNDHVSSFSASEGLVFGKSKVPRCPQGYVIGSIVKQITVGNEIIKGNVLTRPGFGTISFGVMITDEFSRRISTVRIRFGSNPAGNACAAGVETNGIWR